jgi:serine/threonine protein kinase
MSNLEHVMLGDYYLEKQLSGGGIADVYYGYRNGQVDVEVAVKVFHANYTQQPSFRTHLRARLELIAHFEHLHILPMLTYGEHESLLYVVNSYMHAGTLGDLLRRVGGRFSALQALPIVQQLCDAVQYAHERHCVHGNIKPTNIFVSPQGNMQLTDFGVVGDYADGQQLLTQIGWGTAEYTAPEQSVGALQVESDIYALGALFFAILTGVPPFTGQTPVEVLLKHVRVRPPFARELVASVSGSVDDVLQKALRKRADERFVSAIELRDAFVKAVSIAPITPALTKPPFPRAALSLSSKPISITNPHTPIPPDYTAVTSNDPHTPPPALVAPTPKSLSAGNKSFKHIALKRIDNAAQGVVMKTENEEQKDETMAHNWSYLQEEKNESGKALFWSADPAEWSPIGDVSTAEVRDEPLTATDYLQRKPLASVENEPEQTVDEERSEKTENEVLRKWLPLIIVILLLLGLLGAIYSAFL